MDIGNKIRETRIARGMSLAELSQKTNLSQSFISQIERDLNNPSISSLRSICEVLNIPLFRLFLEGDGGEMIVRKNNRRILVFPDNKTVYEIVSPSLDRAFGVLQIRLGPGMKSVERPSGTKARNAFWY